MIKFILKRCLLSLLVVFLVSVFSFSLMHILPGDPARLALGSEASQESVEALRAELNLDKPIVQQYTLWISGVFHGDFGQSITYSRPVSTIMKEKLPRTLAIGLPAMIISILFGICFGIISAVKRGTKIDQIITFLSTIGVGIPVFWVGILGIYIFSIKMGILPIQGFTNPSKNFLEYLWKAVLPVFSLSIGLIASIARQTRSNMLEVINQDYIRTARANGLKNNSIIFKHALKNSLIPVITVIALQVRIVIGGSVIVERVFNIPGVGALLVVAVTSRDYLIVQGCVLMIALITVILNLLVDISYGFFDPRIRESWR